VYGASFMAIDGSHLYAGKFSSGHRDWMYSYTIGVRALLPRPARPKESPPHPNGEAYLLFEPGSYKYNGASGNPAINVIKGVHRPNSAR
jgi:hypothetical protein